MASKDKFDPYNVRSKEMKEIRREWRKNHPPTQSRMSTKEIDVKFSGERERDPRMKKGGGRLI